MALALAPTKRHFGFGDKDDHVVLDGGRVIGRIFLSPQSPPDRKWMWTITAPDYPRSRHSRGYSATRDEAMAAFKARLLTGGKISGHARGERGLTATVYGRRGSGGTGFDHRQPNQECS